MVKRLVVDRDLINAKFETYRYNRDCKYEIHSETIYNQQQIHSFKLNDTDYSYCHATMSSNLNCFYQDRNDPHRVYYITDSGSIIVASPTDPNNSCKFEQFQLFSIPGICKLLSFHFLIYFNKVDLFKILIVNQCMLQYLFHQK